MTRSTKAEKARQLNAALRHAPAARFHCPRQVQRLSREFDLSERQAYRYLEEAHPVGSGRSKSAETTVPITLKLPAGMARILRAYARSSGLTIGAIVTRALAAFLSTQRKHG